jgi:hypothetical protein
MLEAHALHDESRGFRRPALDIGVAGRRVGQRSHEVLAQRAETVRSDVLREVGATRPKHAGDLTPPDLDRVAADHQLEGPPGQGERLAYLRRDDEVHARRPKPRRSRGDTRWEALRRHRQPRTRRKPPDHRPGAGLDVEEARHLGSALHDSVDVPPARTLLDRATIEPAEVPPRDRGLRGLLDEIVEVAHPTILASSGPHHAGDWGHPRPHV